MPDREPLGIAFLANSRSALYVRYPRITRFIALSSAAHTKNGQSRRPDEQTRHSRFGDGGDTEFPACVVGLEIVAARIDDVSIPKIVESFAASERSGGTDDNIFTPDGGSETGAQREVEEGVIVVVLLPSRTSPPTLIVLKPELSMVALRDVVPPPALAIVMPSVPAEMPVAKFMVRLPPDVKCGVAV